MGEIGVVVVPPPARHPLALTAASLLLLGVAVFMAVSFNAMAADEAVHARQLDERLRVAEAEYSQLLAEVAALESRRASRGATQKVALQGAATVEPSAGDHTDPLKPLLAEQ